MPQNPTERPPRYYTFVLRLWAEGGGEAGWRCSLEDPHTGERTGFPSVDALARHLRQWTGRAPEERSLTIGQVPVTKGEPNMQRRIINPWTWQDEFGYVQANEVSHAQRTLYCAGQASNDAQGAPAHPGDMRAQITLALDNLETVLGEAGFGFADIVRLNIYVTDVDAFLANYDAFITRLAAAGCRHAGSLIGVARLAFPEMMIELEATAAA